MRAITQNQEKSRGAISILVDWSNAYKKADHAMWDCYISGHITRTTSSDSVTKNKNIRVINIF